MQSYEKHTSWVNSPSNYVNFFLESPLNSLDLDLGKIIEPCNSFLADVRESEGPWVPKSWGESGDFEKKKKKKKKTGWKPWSSVKQFCRLRSRKSLFAKSKLTNLKFWGGFHKSIYIQTPSVWSLSSLAHTQERRQGVPWMSSIRLSRSGLPSLI